MIQAKDLLPSELRKGNIIKFDDGSEDIVRVQHLSINKEDETKVPDYTDNNLWFVHWDIVKGTSRFTNGASLLCDFEPVLLTEEILLKCGFVKTEANDYIIVDENCWVVKSKDGWDYQVMTSTNDATFYTVATLQYLNQLQNLYYFITGTELTVNLFN